MNKTISFFMLLFFVATILSAAMEGGGGTNATALTQDLTAGGTTLNVGNTSGFLKSSYVIIGNEKLRYTNKTTTTFTGVTRGYDTTTAVPHSRGAKVYSEEASIINYVLGFNVASTGSTVGSIDIILALGKFATVTMPRLITWDYSWLRPSGMVWVRIPLAILTGGFAMYLAWQVAAAFGGVLQSIFVRP